MAVAQSALLGLLLTALTLSSYHRYSSHERASSSVGEQGGGDRNLTVYAMAVGQGDGNIILCPNGRDLIIVDMGAKVSIFANSTYGKYLLKEKFKVLDNEIDIHVVITHPDEDHYNQFKTAFDDDLLKRVKEIVVGSNFSDYGKFKTWVQQTPNMPPVYTINGGNECFGNSECTWTPEWVGLNRYRSMLAAATMHQHGHHARTSQYRSDPWQFCGSNVDITVLGANICIPNENRPGRCINDNKNARSVIMKLMYKDWSLLLSGDFEGIHQQEKLIEQWSHTPSIFQSTYYKVSHHGAWRSKNQANSRELLQMIRPKRAYISHGHPITTFCVKYAHPRCEVIDNLINVGSIERIDPTDSSIVCWQDDSTGKAGKLELRSGYAIYETCPEYQYSPDRQIDRQMCHDILITTNGRDDYTTYEDVPSNYVHSPKRSAKYSPKESCLSGLRELKRQLSQLHP